MEELKTDHPAFARPAIPCKFEDLGHLAYQAAWDLQAAYNAEQSSGARGPVVLYVEHPPVITIGRRGTADDVVAPRKVLESRGIAVSETDRGGQSTYHGPGQLVVYPLLNLHDLELGIHEYLRQLEEAVMIYLRTLDLKPYRWEGRTGVWVGKEKICAMGIRVRKWWTMHGLALNVTTDLNHFGMLIPCGIRDRGVTSIEKLLGEQTPSMDDVKAGMKQALEKALNITLQ